MKSIEKRVKNTLMTSLAILFGNALLAFLVAAFVIPHGIMMGGTTGVGLLLNKFVPLDTATIVLILNVLLLILGGIVLGKKFFVTTVASSLLYPIFLGLIQRIPGITTITDNSLLAALFAGGLLGVAVGMVIRVGSSTGGMDVVTLVLHKWLHLPVSVFVYITDIVVLGGQALFSKSEQILYGIVLLVIETLVLDQVMILGQSQIQVFAVSSKYEEIRKKILTELQAGATMVMIETGCARQQQKGVLCVIPPRKLFAATTMIQSVDPNAFMTVTQIKEVRGQGFTQERIEYSPKNSADGEIQEISSAKGEGLKNS